LPYSVRQQCEAGDYSFNLSTQCPALMAYWMTAGQALTPGSNCHIDPDSKEMSCHRRASCEGGQPYKHHLNYVVYPCDKHCTGSLLIDCCNTCNMYAQDPSAIGVEAVMCEGCEQSLLEAAADEANCQFNGHNFQCSEGGRCDVGRPMEEASTCVIYPCDTCTESVLLRSCCQECVELMCEANSLRRMVCQGCSDVLPIASSSQGGSFAWFFFLILLLGCLAGVGYFFAFIRPKQKAGDDEDEPQEESEAPAGLE